MTSFPRFHEGSEPSSHDDLEFQRGLECSAPNSSVPRVQLQPESRRRLRSISSSGPSISDSVTPARTANKRRPDLLKILIGPKLPDAASHQAVIPIGKRKGPPRVPKAARADQAGPLQREEAEFTKDNPRFK